MKVQLFVPCVTEHFQPRAAEAAARLLAHLGCEVHYPEDQTCCGQPVYNAGQVAEGARLLARMARVFGRTGHRDAGSGSIGATDSNRAADGPDWIVTPSASCAAFAQHHPALAPRVRELAHFLAEVLHFDPARAGCAWSGRAAWHPSCHGRELATPPHAPALLGAVHGLTLLPLPRASQCCGFGGTFATTFPAVSVALGEDKLRAASEADVTTLIVDDGGCRLHLGGLTALGGCAFDLKHSAEIFAEGLGLLARPPRVVTAAALR
jgi:L-lactate dehydrogenase complex protein LldE